MGRRKAVAVKKYESLARSIRGSKIACLCHSKTFSSDHAYTVVLAKDVGETVPCTIRRSIINHNDFKVRIGGILKDTTHRIQQILTLVVSGNDNTDFVYAAGHVQIVSSFQ